MDWPRELHFTAIDIPTSYVITALYREPSGYLWVGTTNGLVRYDGVEPRAIVDPADPNVAFEVRILAGGTSGPRIGTRYHGAMRVEGARDRLRQVSPGAESNGSSVVGFGGDESGRTWVATTSGRLYRIPEGDLQIAGSEHDFVELPDTIRAFFDPGLEEGILWLGLAGGVRLFDTAQKQIRTYYQRPGDLEGIGSETVTALARVDAFIWMGTSAGTLYRYGYASGKLERVDWVETGEAVSALHASERFPGLVWVGTRGAGLWAIDTRSQGQHRFRGNTGQAGSLTGSDVLSLEEDGEGILWVGTMNGLNKALLNRPFFERISMEAMARAGEHPSNVIGVYPRPSQPEDVYLGTLNGPVYAYSQGTQQVGRVSGVPSSLTYFTAFLEDSRGRFWMAGRHRNLYEQEAGTGQLREHVLPVIPRNEQVVVQQIYEMPATPGRLWLSTNGRGLLVFDTETDEVVATYATNENARERLSSSDVWSVTADPHDPHVIWVGTRFGGLNRLHVQDDSVTVFLPNPATACPPRDVLYVMPDRDSTLWVGGYRSGLMNFDPRNGACEVFGLRDGIPDPSIFHIWYDSLGRLWVMTGAGPAVRHPEYGNFVAFSEADGLQSPTFHFQAFALSGTGEVWAGGSKGINRFVPDSLVLGSTPPSIEITRLRIQDSDQDLHEWQDTAGHGATRVAYFDNDIEISYATLHLSQPTANRFRVMLEGADVDFGPLTRETTVRYPNLAPGAYTFRVIGSDATGAWNATGAALRFVVETPFWRAWWFWGSISVFFAALVLGGALYRLAQMRRLDRTRTMIANDLHDDLGSRISSIALQMEMAGYQLGEKDRLRAILFELAGAERRLVDDLRLIVWLVNAENDNLKELVDRMELFADQILLGRRYTFNSPPQIPLLALDMDKRKHLFLFYKEVLHNAVRHSGAAHIDIRVAIEDDQLMLIVEDDGRGFDVASGKRGEGLASLKRRAEAMRSALVLQSEVGNGTRIQLQTRISK